VNYSHNPGLRKSSRILPLIYPLLLSLPLALMAHNMALLPLGYINLEYLLICAFGVFLPRSVFIVLLFTESLADFVFSSQ